MERTALALGRTTASKPCALSCACADTRCAAHQLHAPTQPRNRTPPRQLTNRTAPPQLIKEDAAHLKLRQDRHAVTIGSTRRRAMTYGSAELGLFILSASVQMVLLHLAFRKK